MLKSIISVIAGYFFSVVATKVTDIVITQVICTLIFKVTATESIVFQLFSIFYYLLFALISGYITVKLSRHSELRHDLVLAVMFIIQGIIFMGTDQQLPIWWHTVYVLLVMPTVLLGGFIRMRSYQKEKLSHPTTTSSKPTNQSKPSKKKTTSSKSKKQTDKK